MKQEASTTGSKSRLVAWDERILDALANRAFPRQDPVARVLGLVSHLASGVLCYPLYVLVFGLWPGSRPLIAQVAIADIVGLAVLVGLRYATRRPRPPQRRDHRYTIPWNRYSFPSGHAVRAFAVSVTLAYSGPAWCLLTLPVACVIAMSRITLARHYPSDVLAGTGIGVMAGLACSVAA